MIVSAVLLYLSLGVSGATWEDQEQQARFTNWSLGLGSVAIYFCHPQTSVDWCERDAPSVCSSACLSNGPHFFLQLSRNFKRFHTLSSCLVHFFSSFPPIFKSFKRYIEPTAEWISLYNQPRLWNTCWATNTYFPSVKYGILLDLLVFIFN